MGALEVHHARRTSLSRRIVASTPAVAVNCKAAVRRAWDDLCDLGEDEIDAFRTCTTLYLLRHPNASPDEARDLVAAWLDRP